MKSCLILAYKSVFLQCSDRVAMDNFVSDFSRLQHGTFGTRPRRSPVCMNRNTAVCEQSVDFLWETLVLSFLPQFRQTLGFSRNTVLY